jgi:hypothetical protein
MYELPEMSPLFPRYIYLDANHVFIRYRAMQVIKSGVWNFSNMNNFFREVNISSDFAAKNLLSQNAYAYVSILNHLYLPVCRWHLQFSNSGNEKT